MTASLAGTFNTQQFTDAGNPLVSGRLYTLQYGTNVLKVAYKDYEGTIPHTYTADGSGGQYIGLNARGELTAPLYLVTGSYDIRLCRADGSIVWTRRADPILDNSQSTLALTLQGSGGAAFIGYGTSNVAASLVPTILGNGTTDQRSDIAAAQAFGHPIRILGVCVLTSPLTITVPIVDCMEQIFSEASPVTIANGLPVRPEWFGGTTNSIDRAINALPSTGGVVQLEDKTYQTNGYFYGTSGVGSGKYISKANVSLVGRKMPRLTDDCKSLVGGTIIQGTVLAYADNFEMRDLGVDRGFTVTALLGSISDAIAITYPDNVTKAASPLKKGLRLHNVIALNNSPTDAVHAMIAGEGYSDVTCTGEIVGVYGVHGVVFKSALVKAEQVTAYLNASDGVVIKTDTQATAATSGMQIGRIRSDAGGPLGWSPYATTSTGTGVFLHCFGGNISKVQIDSIVESGHANGVYAQFDGAFVLDNVQIGKITTETNSVAGVYINAPAAGETLQRCQIGYIVARNTPTGAILVWQSPSAVTIEAIQAVNCSNAAVAIGGVANPIIGNIIAENCAAVYQITGTAKPRTGMQQLVGTTAAFYQSSGSGQTVALANGWSQVPGADTFQVVLSGFGVALQGLIQPGTSPILCTLPPFARPPNAKRFIAQGRNGSSVVAVPLAIDTAGNVAVNEIAGGFGNCATWLSLAGICFGYD
jgi:hypothetical protein